MKSDKYLSTLKLMNSRRSASPGERVLSSLLPPRSIGWPGGWGDDRIKQVGHYKQWVYVAVHTICSRLAGISPNLAYVVDAPKPGVTTKASQRGLMNLMGRGYSGSPFVGGVTNSTSSVKAPKSTEVNGFYVGADDRWREPTRYRYEPETNNVVIQNDGNPSPAEYIGCSDGGHSFLTYGEYRSKSLSVVRPHEDLEPLESDHPLRRLIENPNPFDTTFDLFYELQMFEELTGVSYLWCVPNELGVPCEMWVIPSHWVWPRTGGGSYVSPQIPHADEMIREYEVRPFGGYMGSAGTIYIPPDEIVMSLWKSPLSKVDGFSKLSAGAQWIDSDESITLSQWSQFQNVARPELLIELGPGYEDPDDDIIARVETKIMSKFQGEYNYGKPMITPPGAKVTPVSFSPTEMAYGTSEERIRDKILSLFQVPKSSVGISEGMTYGSILATLASLCSQCLNPRLMHRGQILSKHLGSRWSEPRRRVRIWFDDVVPVDPAQVNSDLSSDGQFYAITPNEVRALRGRRSYRLWGDDPIVTSKSIMPLPINTGRDLSSYAALIAPMQPGYKKPKGQGAGAGAGIGSDGMGEDFGDIGLPPMGGGGGGFGGGGGEAFTPSDTGAEGEGSESTGNIEPGEGEPPAEANTPPGKKIHREVRKIVGTSTSAPTSSNNPASITMTTIKEQAPNESDLDYFKRKLEAFGEDDLDGIGVWYNSGPPELIIIDVMDWGDDKVGESIRRLACKVVGRSNVIMHNEEGVPSKGAGWINLLAGSGVSKVSKTTNPIRVRGDRIKVVETSKKEPTRTSHSIPRTQSKRGNREWFFPILENEQEEIDRTAEDLGLDVEELLESIKNGKMTDLEDNVWSQLRNTDSWEVAGLDQASKIAEEHDKDWKSLVRSMERGMPLPAPIVLLTDQGPYLVAGNTRLMVARSLGRLPRVLLADIRSTPSETKESSPHTHDRNGHSSNGIHHR